MNVASTAIGALVALIVVGPTVRAQEAEPGRAVAATNREPSPSQAGPHTVRSRSRNPSAASTAVTRAALSAALARYANEPTITDVLRAARIASRDSTNDELRSRARLSGLVPVIGLKARRGQAVDLASSAADDGLRLSTDDDLTLEAAMTFHLARTVFASEEVSLARDARAARSEASKRTSEIIRLYFERRRLQLERDLLAAEATAPTPPAQADPQADPKAAPQAAPQAPMAEAPVVQGPPVPPGAAPDAGQADLARIIRIAEIEAQLDAFTGGAFRRMMQR